MPVRLAVLMLVLCAPMACRAGELRPEWWPGAVRDANRYGYEVADHADLVRILDTSGGTILDVRPDYEYAAGHLPGAKNLEFHMGDGYSLTPDKRRALLEVLGPDRDQLVIIYCRSLQ